MKYLLFTLLIFSTSILRANAQTFTLPELLRLRNLSYAEFETSVNNKGYQYTDTQNNELYTAYSFSHGEYQGKAGKHITYAVFNSDKTIHLSHQTSFLVEYNRLKKSAIEMNFVFSSQKQTRDKKGIILLYERGERKVWFVTSRSENGIGEMSTFYEVTVE